MLSNFDMDKLVTFHIIFFRVVQKFFFWKELTVSGRASPQWCCRLCIVTFQSGTFLFKMNSVGAIFSKDVFRKLFYSGHHHMWRACISTISWYAIIPDIIIIINVINVIVTVNTHLTVIKVSSLHNNYMFSATEFFRTCNQDYRPRGWQKAQVDPFLYLRLVNPCIVKPNSNWTDIFQLLCGGSKRSGNIVAIIDHHSQRVKGGLERGPC